jgi:hypothetical protein
LRLACSTCGSRQSANKLRGDVAVCISTMLGMGY